MGLVLPSHALLDMREIRYYTRLYLNLRWVPEDAFRLLVIWKEEIKHEEEKRKTRKMLQFVTAGLQSSFG
jgi:hypothetical protein